MPTIQTETARIAGELRKAVYGPAWHGPALLELLADVDAHAAGARPLRDAHTIEEIVRHLVTWLNVVHERVDGLHRDVREDEDWPRANPNGEAWAQLVARVREGTDRLATRIERVADETLDDRLPGAAPAASGAYATLHGTVEHVLYHAGQIAVLKKGSAT